MATYKVITTVDIERMQMDKNGAPVTVVIPAGSVINQIVWDGDSAFTPPLDTRLEKSAEPT